MEKNGVKEERPRRYHTYTKTMMKRIINVALVDMQFPFLLALLGKDNIAETMGGLIITEIVGVFLVYCAKSFFETKEAEKTRLQEQYMSKEAEEIDGAVEEQPEGEELYE